LCEFFLCDFLIARASLLVLRVSFVITFLSFVFYVLLLIGGLFSGNGKSGYQKIGQPENSATRNERVGKTRQQKINVRNKGNGNFGSRKMRGQDVFRSRFQFSSVYVL